MEELKRFRQFLAEGQINENIEQIFKDTYEGYAEGFQGDPDEVDEFTWEAEEMTDPENYEDDRIAQFKAMQDYLKKNKQYTDTIYDAKVTFTLEPNGEDIKMVSDPSSQMEGFDKQVERFPKERSTPIVSRGKAFIKYNDLGPRTTAADIKKWVDDNFEKYAIKGDDKSEVLKTLTAYNDELMS